MAEMIETQRGGGETWSEGVDRVLRGDHVLMLAYVTPASGVVLLPVNNFAKRDRVAGTITATNSSIGGWRKLERIGRNPKVALAYHTREHGDDASRRYVLVQGRASLSEPIPDHPRREPERWELFESWSETNRLWRRWLSVYTLRVEIAVAVERIVSWPQLDCSGGATVVGARLPGEQPAPQPPPAKGTAPRLDPHRAAARAGGLPHVLLGWVGADGYPMAVPVEVEGAEEEGIALRAAPGGLVPPGGRRAGLTAHRFSRGAVGQEQRKHTGWLRAEGGELLYAPHTQSNYRLPASRFAHRLALGGATRLGRRQALRAGFFE